MALGRELSSLLPTDGVVLLIGDLGAGKTTLTKGIAAGRGAAREDEVSSPTFTLVHEYGDPAVLYHADLYRLDTADEVRRMGLPELFERPALVVIEWGERFPELYQGLSIVQIRISRTGEETRVIEVQ